MSYAPTTDFVTLTRQTPGGARITEMPGLDFFVSALARAGLISLSIGQTAPTVNQTTTAWFKPAQPSWSAEGVLYLWNAAQGTYQVATPALWIALLSIAASGYSFQSVAGSTGVVLTGTTLLAIQRNNPANTGLVLPNLAAQFATGKKLQIVDFSTNVNAHTISLTTPDGSTIMQEAVWNLLSTSAQLSGILLTPSPDLNSWIIAP